MSGSNQFSLLRQRRFGPFFLTQFLGAFNDNIFRNGLIILITFQGVRVFGLDASDLANVAGALFILPFFLFSAAAGQLADKYEKSRLIRLVKTAEIVLMLIAAYALATQSFELLFVVLFLMGCQSTMFGPVKYAYLPQQLATDELIGGNALVESGTNMAIIFGLIVGGLAIEIDPSTGTVLSACLVGIAGLGYIASRSIPETRSVDPELRINWNIFTETWRIIAFSRKDRGVFLAILGISWFWFYGSALTLQMPAYTLDILNGNEGVNVTLLAAFMIGVGIGALLCERMSGHRIELGLVPFGSIGLSVFALDLYFAQPDANTVAVNSVAAFLARDGSYRILFDLAMLGAFSGFYSVPLYAYLQEYSERRHLSRIIAANNIINSIFIVAAAVIALLALNLALTIPQFFVALAILNVFAAVYIFSVLPEFLMRFLAWILVNTLYRIRVHGLDNVPDTGPAVLVCNHVSFVDALVIGGSVRRPIRFVMYYKIFGIPLLNFLFRTAKAIPIAGVKEDPDLLDEAFAQIDRELAAGNLVCIFPEGGITSDGEIQSFRPGIEKIIERRPVPVIPVALSGLWGSWFSRSATGGLRRLPGKLFARVNVVIGDAVSPGEANAANLEILVRTLRGQTR